MLEILYKDRHVLAVIKPAGIPSQPDPSGAPDAMSLARAALTEQGESGDLWLVHRLDRVVGGILVFARTKAAAGELSSLFATHEAEKCYLAVTEGEVTAGELCDLLYKDAAKGKSFVVDRARAGVKEARLIAEPISAADAEGGARSLVRVTLLTGRFHQIRAQLSSRRASIVGDGKYGSRDKGARMPALYAYRLTFTLFGKRYALRSLPDTAAYPWSLFDLSEI